MTTNFSTIYLSLLAVGGGMAMLALGGDFLVSGATRLARRWGMSTLLIGLTIVAFGTSMPELFVSLMAIFQNHPDIMAGNVVGSNIANIGLILGISALVAPLPVKFKDVKTELYLVLAGSLMLLAITWHGVFYRPFGLLFVSTLIIYTVQSYRREAAQVKINNSQGTKTDAPYPMTLGKIAVGFAMLACGSDLFIDGAVDVALYFKVSELVIGLTLAAVGTSLPELASSLAAIRHKESDLLVGNIVGSNLFNLLMVLGCASTIRPFALSPNLLTRDLPIMFAFSAVLVPIFVIKHGLSRLHGLLFLVAYGGYIFLLS